MTDNIYRCLCNPAIPYKNRKSFEKHMRLVHFQESIDLMNQIDNDDDD